MSTEPAPPPPAGWLPNLRRKLLVILGPTASGKSDVALAVARRLRPLTPVEILSVDSMQVYREMDAGTAKPAPAERAEAVHHLIDVAEADESFTVARFVERADAVIRDAAARGVPLVATGGAPLYYKALFEGIFEGPGADPALRARLGLLPNEELHRRLAEADPRAVGRIHPNDTRRLVRALEVYELTGRPISSFQNEWGGSARRHPAAWVGLQWDRDALNRRINARAKAMLAAGWLEEARRLQGRFGALSRAAGEATGYHELIEHLAGRLSLEEAVERIKIGTRQLARRQMKWFRRFPHVHWLPGDRPADANAQDAIRLWAAAE